MLWGEGRKRREEGGAGAGRGGWGRPWRTGWNGGGAKVRQEQKEAGWGWGLQGRGGARVGPGAKQGLSTPGENWKMACVNCSLLDGIKFVQCCAISTILLNKINEHFLLSPAGGH